LNPPAALSFSDQIRAMQVAGPAGELIYFTEVSGDRCRASQLPAATHQVNQCFVMINAVTDIQRSIAFYAGQLLHLRRADSDARARLDPVANQRAWMKSTATSIAPIALGPGTAL
jgi:hypothetical protein